MKLPRFFSMVALAFGLAASACASLAPDALETQGWRGKQFGTIRCGGNHFLRLGGTELHFVNYVFRNRSQIHNISVERMAFYDAGGSLIFDTLISGFPAFSNQVLGPTNQVLLPNQTGQLDVTGFLPYLSEVQRPMQAEIHWSAPRGALPLSVDLIRLVQQVDPITKARGAEKTRDSQDCDEVSLN